ncbi:hypothetical protein MTO96_032146 [Rhipicephalus appendiculatus]
MANHPNHRHLGLPLPPADPRRSTGQGSFWSRPYLRGEHSMRPLGRVSSPASTGGHSFRTASHTRDDSSRHAGPVDSPGSSGRQSLEAAPYIREGSPWRRSQGSSSRQGVPHSAKKSAPKAEPEANELSGARQPESSPQRSIASQSTEDVESPSFGPEEPCDNRASTSTGRMDDVAKVKPVANVGGSSEQRGPTVASRPSGQLAPQQGAIKKARKPAGYRVIREIMRLRLETRKLIPRLAFARVVREILQRHVTGGRDLKMQRLALEALQESSEALLVHLLEGANMIARNARRVTIMPRDMQTLLNIIRSYGDVQLSLL